MYFWDCRSRSTLILVLAHLLHRARLITASCSMPTSSADTTEGYSVGGFEYVECECGGDGLFECVQGAAVVGAGGFSRP